MNDNRSPRLLFWNAAFLFVLIFEVLWNLKAKKVLGCDVTSLVKGARSRLNGLKRLAKFFNFAVCNPCQSCPFLTIPVPLWFIIISLVFFYLCKLLFSGFLQFNGNFVDAQNNWAPLMFEKHFNLMRDEQTWGRWVLIDRHQYNCPTPPDVEEKARWWDWINRPFV